jgi:hypothetical protein
MIELIFSNTPLDEVVAQTALLTIFEDVRPLKGMSGLADWRLNGKLSQLVLDNRLSGVLDEALLMPTQGRLDSQELLIMGMGAKSKIRDIPFPTFVGKIVERILLKRMTSVALSLSDLIPEMFDWRSAVRLFVSMISGKCEEMKIILVEQRDYVEDAKRRHMDFSYDVKVEYELDKS